MKKLTIFLVISILFFSCSKTSEHKAETQKEPKTEKKAATDLEVISYRLGFNGVLITLEDFPDVDQEAMARGMKDAFKDSLKPKYDDEAFNRSLAKYRKNKVRVDAKKRLTEFIRNKPISEQFMAENSRRKGVKDIYRGVLIEVLKKGQGEKITMKDLVKVNYKGWDAKGKLFDSSYKRKRPSVFDLNKLIEGLRMAFQEMRKGGKYNVFVPQELGYGSTGFKDRVEAGMALKFEVTVIDVKKNAAEKQAM